MTWLTCHTNSHVANQDDGLCTKDCSQHACTTQMHTQVGQRGWNWKGCTASSDAAVGMAYSTQQAVEGQQAALQLQCPVEQDCPAARSPISL